MMQPSTRRDLNLKFLFGIPFNYPVSPPAAARAAHVGLSEDTYVEDVAAVFTGGCLSAVSALIYFRKKRKRVGMKIEIQYNQT